MRSVRVVVAAALCAAGCGGGDGADDEDRPERETQRAEVTMAVGREDIRLGKGTRVLGELRLGGRPARGEVTIEQDPWPFADDGFTKLRTVRTKANGHWRTPVHPRRNTRFRATASGARSAVATTHVWPVQDVPSVEVGASEVVTKYVVTLPPRVPKRRVRVFLYETWRGRDAFRRVTSGRLQPAGRRLRATFRHRTQVPVGQYVRVYLCYVRPPSPALGRPGEGSDTFCGSRRLNRRSPRL